jgi:3-hydroxypropanoate dehydrogenase
MGPDVVQLPAAADPLPHHAGRESPAAAASQPGNTAKASSAPVNAILAIDSTFHHHIPRLLPFRPQMRDVLDTDPALLEQIGTGSGWLQAAYFISAVRAVGLAAGPMGGFDPEGVDAEFFPEGDWRSLLVVNIGHPGENIHGSTGCRA